jgi:hypothetical protein
MINNITLPHLIELAINQFLELSIKKLISKLYVPLNKHFDFVPNYK